MGEHLSPLVKLLIQFVNFAILVGVIFWFARKPFKDFLKKRHDAVREKMEEAERLLKEAGSAKEAYERRLSQLEAEIEAFRTSVAADVEKEKSRILDEARGLASRIREQARLAYDQEMKEAMAKVRSDIAEMTVKAAEEKVRQMFTKDDHDKMVEEFIERVRSAN
jgi:F-type H+-transporting ATPase subunit b